MNILTNIILAVIVLVIIYALCFIFSKSALIFILGIGGTIAFIIWIAKKSGFL